MSLVDELKSSVQSRLQAVPDPGQSTLRLKLEGMSAGVGLVVEAAPGALHVDFVPTNRQPVAAEAEERSRASDWPCVPIAPRRLSDRAESGFLALGLVGIAGVFLVNALAASIAPAGFVSMVEHSVFGILVTTMGPRLLGWAIAAHDLLVGVMLAVAVPLRRLQSVALAWSGVWLLLVSVTKLTSLGL